MSIAKKKEFFDKMNKREIFENIDLAIKFFSELLEKIRTNPEIKLNENLPNIAVTLNNKVVEISHIFKRAGISMFSETVEGKKLEDGYNVKTSILGDAILKNLFWYLNSARENLESFDIKYKSTTEEVAQWFKERENRDVVRWLWSLIRKKEVTETEEFLDSLEEEVEELECFLEEYIEIDDKLFEYNLEEHIAQSIVEYLRDEFENNEQIVLQVIDNIVKGDLEKLGLSHIIPLIKEEISKIDEKAELQSKQSWELTDKEKNEISKNSIKLPEVVVKKDRIQEASKER